MIRKIRRNRVHFEKMLIAIFLIIVMTMSMALTVCAYTACGYKLNGSWEDEYYYISDSSDGYGALSDNAIEAWNNAVNSKTGHPLDIDLSETSDSDARSTRVVISPLDRGPDGYAGFTYYYDVSYSGVWRVINYGGYPNENYQSGSAVINKYYTDNYSDARAQNVIMHEIGHVFGLAHSSDTSSLMVDSIASKTSLVTPQTDDVNGVRYIYE